MRALLITLALIFLAAQNATAQCRQALALGLDVSGSVDSNEYFLQLYGLADALEDPEVAAVLLSPGFPVHLSVYEWSASAYQRVIVDWTAIDSTEALARVTSTLRGWQRAEAPASTGLGAALTFGAAMIAAAPACDRHTLDISGDGKNNDWPRPDDVKAQGALNDLTINALVIADEDERFGAAVAELTSYFHFRVIQGPGSFMEVALGFEDYADAMKRKLLREIATVAIGSLR